MKHKKRARTGLKHSSSQKLGMFCVYLVLRLLVVAVMISQSLNRNYENVLLCFLTLVLLSIPTFVERRIKIDIPDTLEVIILLFVFAAGILGEIQEYYVNIRGWDTMLHTVNGFLCAAIGLALIDILNRHEKFSIQMSPLYVALMAFCFSMTVGVLWEFFEFGMDMIFLTDMQKDTFVNAISTVALNPDGKNIPVIIEGITKTEVYSSNGTSQVTTAVNGYLDIGIIDTMRDLIVNFIGAAVFSTIGYFYIKRRGEGKSGRFVRRFLPTWMPKEQHK